MQPSMFGIGHRCFDPKRRWVMTGIIAIALALGALTTDASAKPQKTPGKAGARIVNGSANSANPGVVGIFLAYSVNGNTVKAACTGTILNSTTVLTAAHCFDGIPAGETPFEYVYLDWDFSAYWNGTQQIDVSNPVWDKIASVTINPSYNSTTHYADLALITLARAVSITPVQLSFSLVSASDPTVNPGTLDIIGYGSSAYPTSTVGVGTKRVGTANYQTVASGSLIEAYLPSTLGEGDSGGVAFTDFAGTLCQVGVNEADDANTPDISYYTNLADFQSFISQVPISTCSVLRDEPVPGDFLGLGYMQMAVFRPQTAMWYVRESNGTLHTYNYGGPSIDVPVQGKYNSASGPTSLAVYRPSQAQWYIGGNSQPINFGEAGVDMPEPADYNGTGTMQIAVYRPPTATWYIAGQPSVQFGAANTDIPVPGKYVSSAINPSTGLRLSQIAVYRPSTGTWYIGGQPSRAWGEANVDIPVPGDYDGDGVTDIAVFRPPTGEWFISGSTLGYIHKVLGGPNSVPIPGYYNGFSQPEAIAVFDTATGNWQTETVGAFKFGIPGGAQPLYAGFIQVPPIFSEF